MAHITAFKMTHFFKSHRSYNQTQIKFLSKNFATVFSGIRLSEKIQIEVRNKNTTLSENSPGFKPKLAAITVGHNPASKIYLKRKHEAAKFCGIYFDTLCLPADTREENLRDLVRDLNSDPSVHGVIVQLPLPPHLDELRVCNTVDPRKDVDGFTQTNLGRVVQGLDDRSLIPCTSLAVKRIIQEIGIRKRFNQEHKSNTHFE